MFLILKNNISNFFHDPLVRELFYQTVLASLYIFEQKVSFIVAYAPIKIWATDLRSLTTRQHDPPVGHGTLNVLLT